MTSAAIPLVLIAVFLGGGEPESESVSVSHDPREPGACPAWFKEAPALGPGQPKAVSHVGELADATVCQYHGPPVGPQSFGPNKSETDLLAEKTILRSNAVRSLARSFNRLARYSHVRGGRHCPPESGGRFYIRFSYQSGNQASVRAFQTGCQRAVAGRHGRWLILTSSLERRLLDLVR